MSRARLVLGISLSVAAGYAVAACVGDAPAGDDTSTITDSGTDASVSNNDASNVTDGGGIIDSGPLTFCKTATPPDGSADFFCADFDESPDFTTGFTSSLADSGTLALATDVAFSLPSSLSSTAHSPSNVQYANLSWVGPGAKSLDTVTVSAEVNPLGSSLGGAPATGDMYLLEIKVANLLLEWSYVNGITVDGGAYTGYALHFIGGGSVIFNFAVPAISSDVWTKVALSYDLTSGNVVLAYEGASVYTTNLNYGASSTVTAVVGCDSFGNNSGGTWRFDNFEVATTRAP